MRDCYEGGDQSNTAKLDKTPNASNRKDITTKSVSMANEKLDKTPNASNRKDIKTKSGYIFNVPDYYPISESDENLIGLIEIPLYNQYKVGTNGGGPKKKETAERRVAQAAQAAQAAQRAQRAQRAAAREAQRADTACTIALQNLITERLGRGAGGRTNAQIATRSSIIAGIIADILSRPGVRGPQSYTYTNLQVEVKVSDGGQDGTNRGLFIAFKTPRTRPNLSPFHVSVHDGNYQRNPQEYNGSMAHSRSDIKNPKPGKEQIVTERQSLLRLDCNNTQNDGREEIQFTLEVANRLQASNETMAFVNATIHNLNLHLFNTPMYVVDGSWTGTLPFTDADFPVLVTKKEGTKKKGGRTLKYKKIKNIKRKSIKINKSSKKNA